MTGQLRKNANGRWEIVDDSGDRIELTCGSRIKVLVGEHFIVTSIEYGPDGGYYATTPGLLLFSGMRATDCV